MDRHSPAPHHYIREWRRHRGLTQGQLADAISLDRSQLNKIERGRRYHARPVLEVIAAKLEREPNELVRRHPSHTSELETLYRALLAEDRNRAAELLKSVFSV